MDDVITVNSPKGEEWKDDGIQVFIDYPWAGGAYGSGTLRMGLTPTDTAGAFSPVVYDWGNLLAVNPDDIKAASVKTDNGYTLEVAIPWAMFKGFEPPVTGQVMGFDFAFNDHDLGEEAQQAPIGAAVYLWAGNPSVGGDANQFGDMILMD